MYKNSTKWRKPELIQYNVEELFKKITVRAWSNDDLCEHDVLKEGYGGTEGGGSGLGGNETVCIDVGPFGGCSKSIAGEAIWVLR